jgi:hypothetical protein
MSCTRYKKGRNKTLFAGRKLFIQFYLHSSHPTPHAGEQPSGAKKKRSLYSLATFASSFCARLKIKWKIYNDVGFLVSLPTAAQLLCAAAAAPSQRIHAHFPFSKNEEKHYN